MRTIFILALLLAASEAVGETCPDCADVSWTPSTVMTNGAAITGAVTYTLSRVSATGTGKVLYSGPLLAFTARNEPVGTQCYVVTATVADVVSVASNQACKKLRLDAPTDGALEDKPAAK